MPERNSVTRPKAATPSPKAPPPVAATGGSPSAVGNLQVQRALATPAKLWTGEPGDADEREAKRVADAFVEGGRPPPRASRCNAGNPASCTCARCRKPAPPAESNAAAPLAGATRDSRGVALAPALRDEYERFFRTDLRGTRVHVGDRADAAARLLGAKAFARGNDIYFARDRFAPHTRAGRRLLAHELTHVLRHGGTRRDETNQSMGDATASVQPPPEPARSSLLEPAQVTHQPDFNPCNVNVTILTNYELLAEYQNALRVVQRGRDAAGYFDYRNLQRRLAEERDRRFDLGHKWLATLPASIPASLYRVVDRGDGTQDVLEVPGASVAGAPENVSSAPLMTREQYDRFLQTRAVQRMNAEAYRQQLRDLATGQATFGSLAVTGAGLYRNPLDSMLIDPFLLSPGSNKWLGRLGETGFEGQASQGYGSFLDSMNTGNWVDRNGRTHGPTEENYPLMDFQRTGTSALPRILGVVRVSNKVSTQAAQGDRLSYFREGMQALLDTGQSAMPTYVANQPEFAGQPTTGPQYEANRSAVISDAVLAVNSDDVAEFRRLLSDPSQRESSASTQSMWEDTGLPWRRATPTQPGQRGRAGWRQIFEGEMRESPVELSTTTGPRTFRTPADLDQALQAGQITQEQHLQVQREVGRRAARRVVSTNMSTAELTSLRSSRQALGPLSDLQLENTVTPEFMRGQRLGGGLLGETRAAGAAGLQGGALSGGLAVITTAGIMWLDEADHPNWQSELALTGGLGFGGGAVGSATEQVLVSGLTRMTLGELGQGGAATLSRGAVTGLGRFGGGAVGAVFVEGISMAALEDREHSGAEVATRSVRAAGIGGASVWAGAAIGGAVGGPIGFIVGLAIGGLLYYAGDRLIPGGREDWDAHEAGCQPLPTIRRWTEAASSVREPAFHCFDGHTPVLMADGTERAIAQVRVGEEVVSYDGETGALVARRVTRVHQAEAAPLLRVRCADGSLALVTPMHRFGGPLGWCTAGELRCGDELFVAAPLEAPGPRGRFVLRTSRLASIETAAPRGSVFDLSVDGSNNYFAGGLLAHNKMF